MATQNGCPPDAETCERLERLRDLVEGQGKQIEAINGTLNQVLASIHGVLLPAQREQAQKLASVSKELENIGGSLDHALNTIDTILMPASSEHAKKIEAHDKVTSEAHDYIMSQRGAWSLIQKGGIVIAALSGLVTMIVLLSKSFHQ